MRMSEECPNKINNINFAHPLISHRTDRGKSERCLNEKFPTARCGVK